MAIPREPDPSDGEVLAERYSRLTSSIVHDVVRASGETPAVLPRSLRSIVPGRRLVGPAFPVAGTAVPGHDAHETLLAWTAMLSRVPPGHVLVLQPNDDIVAHMGELSAEALVRRRVAGAIIDGGCRDVARVNEIGFSVFCRYATPRDVVGQWLPTRFAEPVAIGGCTIALGDMMIADDDGVCVVRARSAEAIADAAEAAAGAENRVRSAILAGTDPETAYRTFGKF